MAKDRPSAKVIGERTKTPGKDSALNFEDVPSKESKKEKLERKTYYMDQDLINALALKAFTEEKDKSRIVREALYEYIEKKYFIPKPTIKED